MVLYLQHKIGLQDENRDLLHKVATTLRILRKPFVICADWQVDIDERVDVNLPSKTEMRESPQKKTDRPA